MFAVVVDCRAHVYACSPYGYVYVVKPQFKRHSSLKKPRFSVSSSNSVKQECAMAHAFFVSCARLDDGTA
jgi:hypothetical protein